MLVTYYYHENTRTYNIPGSISTLESTWLGIDKLEGGGGNQRSPTVGVQALELPNQSTEITRGKTIMRYSVVSEQLSLPEIEEEILKIGGKDISKAECVSELFCNLDELLAQELAQNLPDLKIRLIRPVKVIKPIDTATAIHAQHTQGDISISQIFEIMRTHFTPPLTGTGLTIAILDTGVRGTHDSIKGKVVYSFNTTRSPTHNDIHGHGTGVAYLIAGSLINGRGGVSPGASLMNIKVLDDEGVGTDETIIMGINKVCKLAQDAHNTGLPLTDKLYPNIINASFGAEDTGEVDDPIRLACRRAIEYYGIDVIAAAGNSGPKRTTVMLPATEPKVIAVGGIITGDLQIWGKSSRGPTVLGDTKPDFVFWATSLEVASHRADDVYDEMTGTSFAAPMVSGLAGLLWETGRRTYGEGWLFRWSEAIKLAPFFTIRPPGAPKRKGNTYGYGVPAMGAMVQMIEGVEPTYDMTNMSAMLPMIMMVGMMGAITRG